MRLKLCAIVVSALSVWIGGNKSVSAAAIPNVNNLQDLINRGSLPSNGIQIGNDVFYNFSYSGSPAPGNPGAPTPGTISVTSTDTGTGLHFSFNWSSAEGSNQSSNISYFVHVVDTVPQQFINGAILNMQSSVNAVSPADNATTTTTFSNPDTLVAFDQQTVVNTNTNPAQVFTNNLGLPLVRDFALTDGVVVHTGTGGGTASITYIENIFSQVPEPTSVALITGLALLLPRTRRLD